MSKSETFWQVNVDFDDAQERYNSLCKAQQLYHWREFETHLKTVLGFTTVPVVYGGNLSPHQIESVLQDENLLARFHIEYADKFFVFLRK